MNITELLGKVPNLTGPVDHDALMTYLKHHQDINVNSNKLMRSSYGVVEQDAINWDNVGWINKGCYCPVNDRFYLIPTQEQLVNPDIPWHYMDCKTGKVMPYYSGIEPFLYHEEPWGTLVVRLVCYYTDMVFSPTQNRMYLIPCIEKNREDEEYIPLQLEWHYIDCVTGLVVAYEHGVDFSELLDSASYHGGAYSPVQNRIYFVPYMQLTAPLLHYIDCDTGQVLSYESNLNLEELVEPGGFNYLGGTYSPTQDRIYLHPANQAMFLDMETNLLSNEEDFNKIKWHYIDCATNTIGSYDHGIQWRGDGEILDYRIYENGVYSPTQNRIYFILLNHSPDTEGFHYIDCDTGECKVFPFKDQLGENSIRLESFWWNYSPITNRMYVSSYLYLDCNTDKFVSELPEVPYFSGGAPYGLFSPLNNRIYYLERNYYSNITGYKQEYPTATLSPQLLAHSMFK